MVGNDDDDFEEDIAHYISSKGVFPVRWTSPEGMMEQRFTEYATHTKKKREGGPAEIFLISLDWPRVLRACMVLHRTRGGPNGTSRACHH